MYIIVSPNLIMFMKPVGALNYSSILINSGLLQCEKTGSSTYDIMALQIVLNYSFNFMDSQSVCTMNSLLNQLLLLSFNFSELRTIKIY